MSIKPPDAPRRIAFEGPEIPVESTDEPDDLASDVSRETTLPRPAATRIFVIAN